MIAARIANPITGATSLFLAAGNRSPVRPWEKLMLE